MKLDLESIFINEGLDCLVYGTYVSFVLSGISVTTVSPLLCLFILFLQKFYLAMHFMKLIFVPISFIAIGCLVGLCQAGGIGGGPIISPVIMALFNVPS